MVIWRVVYQTLFNLFGSGVSGCGCFVSNGVQGCFQFGHALGEFLVVDGKSFYGILQLGILVVQLRDVGVSGLDCSGGDFGELGRGRHFSVSCFGFTRGKFPKRGGHVGRTLATDLGLESV